MYLFFLRTWSKEIYTQSMRCKNKLNLSPIILILQIFDFSLLSTNWWKFKFLSPHFELSVVFLFLYENNFQMIKCWVSTNKIEHFSTKHQKKKKFIIRTPTANVFTVFSSSMLGLSTPVRVLIMKQNAQEVDDNFFRTARGRRRSPCFNNDESSKIRRK